MSNIYGDIAGDIALTVKPDFRELYKADAVAKKLAAEQKKQAEEGKQKRLDAATKRLLEYSKMPDESKLHRDVRPEVQQKYAEFMKAALQSVITSDPTDVEKAWNLANKFEKDLASVYFPASEVGFAADKQLQERGVLASEKEFQGLGKGWRNWNFDPEMTGFRVDPSQNLYQIGNVSRVQEIGKAYRDVAKANEGSFTEKGVAINLPFGNRLVPLSPKTAAKLDAFQGAVLQNPEAQTYFLRSALQNGLISRGTFNAFQKNPAALIDSLSIDDTKGAVIGNPASIESKEFARAVNKFLEDNPVSETVRVSPQIGSGAGQQNILPQNIISQITSGYTVGGKNITLTGESVAIDLNTDFGKEEVKVDAPFYYVGGEGEDSIDLSEVKQTGGTVVFKYMDLSKLPYANKAMTIQNNQGEQVRIPQGTPIPNGYYPANSSDNANVKEGVFAKGVDANNRNVVVPLTSENVKYLKNQITNKQNTNLLPAFDYFERIARIGKAQSSQPTLKQEPIKLTKEEQARANNLKGFGLPTPRK